jgi:hypothetical protein
MTITIPPAEPVSDTGFLIAMLLPAAIGALLVGIGVRRLRRLRSAEGHADDGLWPAFVLIVFGIVIATAFGVSGLGVVLWSVA